MTMNWESAELTKYAANSHARRPHLVHERDDDSLRGLRRRHRRHPQGHRLRLPHRPGVPAAGCGYGGSLLPQRRGRHGAHLSRLRATRACSSTRFRPSTRTRRSGLPTKIAAEARPADRRGEDRRLGSGVQSRHRRHPRIGRAGRDPLSAGQRARRRRRPIHKAMENMKQVFKDEVEWSPDPVHAAVGADAVALLTDWPQYTTLPFRKIAATMNQPIIFDGRNCLHRDVMREDRASSITRWAGRRWKTRCG